MPIDYSVQGYLPCPICGETEHLYIANARGSDYYHVTCTKCEIDTFLHYKSQLREWWNSLPRHHHKESEEEDGDE